MSNLPSKPFSNGTEYEVFKYNFCEDCKKHKIREDGFPALPEDGGCPIEDAMENARFDQCDAIKFAYGSAKEIVQKVAEEYNDGWIPCSERLPSKEEFIKSYIGKMYGAEFIVMIEGANRPTTLYYTLDGMWKNDYGEFHKVIAWRLLPEPYKGSSQLHTGKENYV